MTNDNFLSLKQITDPYLYHTTDLCLASALSLLVPVEQLDRTNPYRVQFVFARTPELEAALDKYVKGQIVVEVKQFYEQMRLLKTQIHQGDQ